MVLGGLLTGRGVLQRQAAAARRIVGKPLGEDAHRADKVWKKTYGDPLDLLVLGDSIAAGLGADSPGGTFGAQLAKRLAKAASRSVRLHTAAVVGAESSMLRAQLAGLPGGYRPDVAVIVVGGNDVTHRVRVSESRRHLAEAISTLRAAGVPVVVGTCPDLGALGVLQQPLRTLARVASRQLAAAQRDVALEQGALAVSLADVVGPFFVTRPDEMFAVDRFHPSSAGYKRTAKAVLPSVLVALSLADELPHGHHAPAVPLGEPGRGQASPAPAG
ncbi:MULTISPECIES: SGNH/GDSL hydrolase family protein [unclassified Nocardioides]|uniref:SGNH/GDSL hydrolase family protein n=1 Tax=unclassified Nocardioides TaxID=2615069 RepID=UPI0026656E8A|nr:SGNH/GDSL hydrolase family protein [Nocardioides sp. Arc9.136]WKN48103.1 SGNH/GDSL hydrolase family protein [Nocardioides sp. Arc9.136]